MRVFISIGWSQEGVAFLQMWQKKLQQEYGLKGYWRKPGNLHLTLKFLGEVGEKEIPNIHRVLRDVSSQFCSFEVIFKNMGVFPNARAPRILWMGVLSSELILLQAAIEGGLKSIGIPPEHRKYRPHITLASGGISGIDEKILREDRTSLRKETVTTFELMQSINERGGYVYRPLERYLLKRG